MLAAAAVGALLLAGCGGQTPTGGDSGGGQAGTGEMLRFAGTDQLKFSEAPSETASGTHTVELIVDGAVNHNVVFEGVNGDRPVVEADGGETATGTVTLRPGEYTFYCSVPGHRAAGMEGALTVRS